MKYIAFLSMFIDHTNKALIYPNLDGGALNRLSDFFDILGRIAFPIFIFLLVEGYFHTSTKWRYLVTLLVFGVISEVPFDMCTSARFVEINWNNIMFTLALVLAMIWVIDVLKEKMASLPKALWYFVSFLIVPRFNLVKRLHWDCYRLTVAIQELDSILLQMQKKD